MKPAALLYVLYFALAISGETTKYVPLQLIGTASYFVLAIAIYRLFGPADPRVALLLLPLAAIGCVLQAIGQLQGDAGLLRLALLPFALYLAVLGYLILRSTFAPTAVGVLVLLAGVVWPLVQIPGVPTFLTAVAFLVGIIGEGALAIWLLVAAFRTS